MEKSCYLITYTVAIAVAFGTARVLFCSLKLPTVSVEGLDVAVAALPKPPVASPDTEECADSSTTLGSLFHQGGLSGAATNPPLAGRKTASSFLCLLGHHLPKPHSCGPVWKCDNHQFADPSPDPVLPLLGGLQNLPMSWGFCSVSKGSVPGQ